MEVEKRMHIVKTRRVLIVALGLSDRHLPLLLDIMPYKVYDTALWMLFLGNVSIR